MTGGDQTAIAGGEDSPAKETVAGEIWWGTLEELLLAYAVRRHGAARWDSVAIEVRSRVPSANLLTAEDCEEHFRLLQRRFAGDVAAAEFATETAVEEGDKIDSVPWLDELRRLRVAELRLQVKRSDDSIKSLELKVKRLKEEREREQREPSKTGGDGGGHRPDPQAGGRRIAGSLEGRISGGSCKESNSTHSKREEEVRRPGGEGTVPDPQIEPAYQPVTAGDENSEADQVRVTKAGTESADESRESSDVQSSASLSRRRRGGRRSRGVARLEPDADVASTVKEDDSSRSEPLVSVFDLIWSSESGAVFEHRLESQESPGYRNLIRRHVDLETLRAKLDSGVSYSPAELFRDLLLLCANASLFFPKDSSKFSAAAELRRLVTKEMAAFFPPSSERSSKDETSSTPSLPLPVAANVKGERSDGFSLVKKMCSLSAPMVACRKRGSITAMAVKEEKEEEEEEKEKPAVSREDEEKEQEEEDGEKEKDEDDEVLSIKMKKRERDRPSSHPSTKGLRTNKSRAGKGLPKSSNPSGNAMSPVPSADSKPEVPVSTKAGKKNSNNNNSGSAKNNNSVGTKKGNSSELLSRVKQRIAAESSKSLPSSSSGKAAKQKKGCKGDGRKDGCQGGAATRRATAAAAAAEKNTLSKRLGRPPKMAATAPAKRLREEAETPLPRPRKRGRR